MQQQTEISGAELRRPEIEAVKVAQTALVNARAELMGRPDVEDLGMSDEEAIACALEEEELRKFLSGLIGRAAQEFGNLDTGGVARVLREEREKAVIKLLLDGAAEIEKVRSAGVSGKAAAIGEMMERQ